MRIHDTLLFQHVYSGSQHARLLALTAPRTILYCLEHNLDYQMTVGEVEGDNRDGGHWAQVCLMRAAMRLGYANVIYLDADTLIADLKTDLREAIVVDKIGAVWHNLKRKEGDYSHFNAGAFYASNTEKTRAFVETWLAGYPGLPMSSFPLTGEQGVFNVAGKDLDIINSLDPKWNAEAGVSPSSRPVVLGFHGFPDTLLHMQRKLTELENK